MKLQYSVAAAFHVIGTPRVDLSCGESHICGRTQRVAVPEGDDLTRHDSWQDCVDILLFLGCDSQLRRSQGCPLSARVALRSERSGPCLFLGSAGHGGVEAQSSPTLRYACSTRVFVLNVDYYGGALACWNADQWVDAGSNVLRQGHAD